MLHRRANKGDDITGIELPDGDVPVWPPAADAVAGVSHISLDRRRAQPSLIGEVAAKVLENHGLWTMRRRCDLHRRHGPDGAQVCQHRRERPRRSTPRMARAKRAEKLLDRIGAQVSYAQVTLVQPPAQMRHEAHQLGSTVRRVAAGPEHFLDAVPERPQRTIDPYPSPSCHSTLLSLDEAKSLRGNANYAEPRSPSDRPRPALNRKFDQHARLNAALRDARQKKPRSSTPSPGSSSITPCTSATRPTPT